MSQTFSKLLNAGLLIAAGALMPSTALAADAKPSEPPTIKLVLYPADAPAAALAYPLLPKFLDRTPGNAATLYLKAELLMANRQTGDVWEKIDRWSEAPPADLPKGEVHAVLAPFAAPLSYVKIAAHRDRCDWDEPIRESNHPFEILLPEMQSLRNIGNLVALQARLQIAEGHPVEAIATLRIGFAMAKHASNCSFLVSELVAQAIANMMTNQLETLIQSKGCPNLYWSLAMLPQPFIDYRQGLDEETASIYQEFPQLRDVEHSQRTAEEWQAQLGAFALHWNEIAKMNGNKANTAEDVATVVAMATLLIAEYPRAKAGLIAAGRERARIDAMPPAQAILAYAALRLDRSRDEVFKWYGLPYWQAREGIAAAAGKIKTEAKSDGLFSIASVLVPGIAAVRATLARSERRMAALRVVESIRMYAAAHDGKLPARLDELTEAPAPTDPVTGKPFDYKMADGKAVLEGTPPVGDVSLRYELTIAASKK
jgi:hypothetical protein